MIHKHHTKPNRCAGDCDGCGVADDCDDRMGDRPLKGWGMVGSSVMFFILPLILVLVGAVILRSEPGLQVIGGVGGLVIGMTTACLLARLINRKCGFDGN